MIDDVCTSWQKVWRDGIAPQLSSAALEALASGLAVDDPTLLQGATTEPSPLQCCQNWPVTGACGITYAGWKGDHLEQVADAEAYFGRVCFQCDQALGEPAAVRYFVNWFDETPRSEMRRQLLAEVQQSLARRQKAAPAA